MKIFNSFPSQIDLNYFTSVKSDAILFHTALSNVYKETKFYIIQSGDCYYICGEIYVTKETIKDHKYQIDYLAYYYGCKKYEVDVFFDYFNNPTFIYRNVV